MSDKKPNKLTKKPDENGFKGEGRRLNDVTTINNTIKNEIKLMHNERVEPSYDAKQAGQAALLRLSDKFSRSNQTNNIHKNIKKVSNTPSKKKSKESFAVKGVFFTCPALGPEILTEKEWKDKISRYLKRQLEVDKHVASSRMIHTLNGISAASKCVETIDKIINNIILHPDAEKFKKIRTMNYVFQERINNIVGGIEFLESIGFVKQSDASEDFYIFPSDEPDIDKLKDMLHLLHNTLPIKLELHRNLLVFKPTRAPQNIELPDDFYDRTVEDVKQEQVRRSESLEKLLTLQTKEMRIESDKRKNTNKYLFTLIRVRFPDGYILQATFGGYETLGTVRSFVREYLSDSVGLFSLNTALGTQLPVKDDDKTLRQLNLMPAVLLTFVPFKMKPSGQSYLIASFRKN